MEFSTHRWRERRKRMTLLSLKGCSRSENHRNCAVHLAAVSHPIISARVHDAYDRQLQAELSISVFNQVKRKQVVKFIILEIKYRGEALLIYSSSQVVVFHLSFKITSCYYSTTLSASWLNEWTRPTTDSWELKVRKEQFRAQFLSPFHTIFIHC